MMMTANTAIRIPSKYCHVTLDEVSRGYHDDLPGTFAYQAYPGKIYQLERRLFFWTDPVSLAMWRDVMIGCAAEYNGFNVDTVYEFLKRWDNGIRVMPARENSVCLYIEGDPETLAAILAAIPMDPERFCDCRTNAPYPGPDSEEPPFIDEAWIDDKTGYLRLWWD